MEVGLAAHDGTLSEVVQAHRGIVIKRTGDRLHVVFSSPADAVRAAVDAQRQLTVGTRMGIHNGEALARKDQHPVDPIRAPHQPVDVNQVALGQDRGPRGHRVAAQPAGGGAGRDQLRIAPAAARRRPASGCGLHPRVL
jgi:hypothetical protein